MRLCSKPDNSKNVKKDMPDVVTRYTDTSKSISLKSIDKVGTPCNKQVTMLFWSWIVLMLGLLPILVGLSLMKLLPLKNTSAFIYFNLEANHSFAIKTTFMSGDFKTDPNEVMLGYTK